MSRLYGRRIQVAAKGRETGLAKGVRRGVRGKSGKKARRRVMMAGLEVGGTTRELGPLCTMCDLPAVMLQ